MSSSNDTLKYDDEKLAQIAQQVNGFITAFEADENINVLKLYSGGLGNGVDNAGNYTALMPGSSALPEAGQLQAAFKTFCADLLSDLDGIHVQAKNLVLALETAKTTLLNGEHDAISVAQMQEVLTSVYNDLGGSPGGPPGYLPGTNPNVSVNTTPPPNVNN